MSRVIVSLKVNCFVAGCLRLQYKTGAVMAVCVVLKDKWKNG